MGKKLLDVPLQIIKNYKIKLLVVFGSCGSKYEKEDSDLDLAFLPSEIIGQEKEFKLLNELMSFYNRGNIDLVNLYKANPGLKYEIARTGRLLYEDKGELLSFQLYAAARYADTKYLREDRRRCLEEKLKKYEGGANL